MKSTTETKTLSPLPQKVLDWLTETLNRFFHNQPQYFKYWTWLGYALTLISGLPYLIVQFHIKLPEPFATMSNKFISGVAIALVVMSKLTIKNPTVGQTKQGEAVKVTSEKTLPFTAKAEKQVVEDTEPQPPVIKEIKT